MIFPFLLDIPVTLMICVLQLVLACSTIGPYACMHGVLYNFAEPMSTRTRLLLLA